MDRQLTGLAGTWHGASVAMAPGQESWQENLWSGPTGDFPLRSHKDIVVLRRSQLSLAAYMLLQTPSKVTNKALKHGIITSFPVFTQFPSCAQPTEPYSSTGGVCRGGKEPVRAVRG